MKCLIAFLALFFPASLFALTYDSGGGAAGADQGDILSGSTANAVVYTNSSKAITTGSGLTYDGTTFTSGAHSASSLTVNGNVTLSSMSVVDAFNASFGSVTSGSTSTLTWTEVTDRLSEFVTSSFTAITAGFYELTADASASQTAGTGCLLIKVNGAEPLGGESCVTGATALLTVLDIPISRILNLSANDIVRIDGSATSANVTFQKMHLAIRRVP